jgi:hypothetical protein
MKYITQDGKECVNERAGVVRWTFFALVIGFAVIIGSVMITTAGEPLLKIVSPEDGANVTSDTITVCGYAMGTSGTVIELVTVNGVPADGTTSWNAEVLLHEAENTIVVIARDEFGSTNTTSINVTQVGAILILSSPSNASIKIDGNNVGNTPQKIEIKTGEHNVELGRKHYLNRLDRVWVTAGETSPVAVELRSSYEVFNERLIEPLIFAIICMVIVEILPKTRIFAFLRIFLLAVVVVAYFIYVLFDIGYIKVF